MLPYNATALMRDKFKYHTDGKGLFRDNWKILRNVKSGVVRGDCEDYALTVLWLVSDGRMWRFWWNLITWKYMLYWCVTGSGGRHVVLWARGIGWVDNISREWVSARPPYSKFVPYTVFGVLIKFALSPITRRL